MGIFFIYHPMLEKPLLVIIEGPTGVGKTDVGIELAQWFKSEIISADSRQFYKELHIGTAKQTPSQLAAVPHHFVNTISVFDYYNAWMFDEQVQLFLHDYFKRNPICLMVGGSGMYIDAVCNGIDPIPDIDSEIRREVTEQFNRNGIKPLQEELRNIDFEYYSQVDLHNSARLIRAIEVFKQTGKTFSSFRSKDKKKRDYTIVKIALERPKNELYDRINRRTHLMIQEGLEGEAMQWNDFRHLNALQTVGYKEFFNYFDGSFDLATTISKIQQNTRHYAKKQATWFRKDIETQWIFAEDIDLMIQNITRYL